MTRRICDIAFDIKKDWSKQGKGVSPYAAPYLDAMFELTTIAEMYYLDSAKSIILYFLANAQSWRGETARKVKTELSDLCND